MFPINYRQRIEFFPRKVWQISAEKISQKSLEHLCDVVQQAGFKVNKTYDIDDFICYGNYNNYYTIFHDGTVDKCANIELKDVRGRLNSHGDIEWNTSLDEFNQSVFTMDIPCRQCKYLPLCMGPCPVRRRAILEGTDDGFCPIKNKSAYFSEMISNYFLAYYNAMKL